MTLPLHSNSMPARHEERIHGPTTVQILRNTGKMHSATVRNLSSLGLQATCFNAPIKGERITIYFDNGEIVDGVVRWLRKGVFGTGFLRSIDVEAISETSDT